MWRHPPKAFKSFALVHVASGSSLAFRLSTSGIGWASGRHEHSLAPVPGTESDTTTARRCAGWRRRDRTTCSAGPVLACFAVTRPRSCCHWAASCRFKLQGHFRLVFDLDELRVIEGVIAENVQDRRESLCHIGCVNVAIERAFQESATGVALSALTIRRRRRSAGGLQLVQYVGEGSRAIVAGQARRLEEHLDELGAHAVLNGCAKAGLARFPERARCVPFASQFDPF